MRELLSGRRMLTRVFLYGLLVIFASAVAAVSVSSSLVKRSIEGDMAVITRWMGPRLCEELRDHWPPAPSVPRATLYDESGSVRGTSVTPPLAPLTLSQRERLPSHGLPGAFACPAGGYVLMGPAPTELVSRTLALVVLAIILIVALSSLPFARSITTPIEQVVSVARTFGGGNLSARAESARTDEVGDLCRAFNEMAEQLQALIQSEKELLANVSHELRTPLARIRVVVDLAQENPQRALSLLGEISRDLMDLERLVESVLAAFQLDVGSVTIREAQLPVRLQPTDVGGVVIDAVTRLREAYPERAIDLEVGDESLDAAADVRLLRRLLDNVLENAHKYSGSSERIRVRVWRDSKQVMIQASDDGVGIDPHDLPHVFEPFFRADRSRSRDTGGVGLGLALAKKIADIHQGVLTIESQPDMGTTVTLRLPGLPGTEREGPRIHRQAF